MQVWKDGSGKLKGDMLKAQHDEMWFFFKLVLQQHARNNTFRLARSQMMFRSKNGSYAGFIFIG